MRKVLKITHSSKSGEIVSITAFCVILPLARRFKTQPNAEAGRDVVTREEHRNIIAFIDEAVRQDLASPPVDIEADAIIRALFVRNPEAAYRVTRLAMEQREALAQLKTELAEAKSGRGRNWYARLFTRPSRKRRNPRRDPDLSMLTQDARGG
jgi:hypothetical protein